MLVDLTAPVALELYREDVIDKSELRTLFGIPSAERTKPERKWYWKIGDIVEGSAAYDSLPVGAVIGSARAGVDTEYTRTSLREWRSDSGMLFAHQGFDSARTIKYLPN